MSFQIPVTIAQMMEGIQSNKYVLPAIQREFVWDTEQIEKLFDSLMRGYPIGSFLFWEVQPDNVQNFQFYRFMDKYHQRDHRHNEPLDNLVGQNGLIAVLDGQQRLTALSIGLRGWYAEKLPYYRWNSSYAFPPRRLYLNLLEQPADAEFAYEFRMLRDKEAQSQDGKFWFPVRDILRFKDVDEVFYFCVDKGLTKDGSKFASSALIALWRIVHEKQLINYFLEKDQDLDKVLNIFIRVNSGGTQLSYSDMLLSIATAQWQEKDARKEIYEFVDELNRVGEGFAFGKDFVLKACLVLADISTIAFKVDSFNRNNMLEIEKQWDGITRAVRLAVNLISSWGYSWQTLVSNNAIIPIAYYLYKKGTPYNFVDSDKYREERDTVHRWLIVALLKRVFGGQSDSTLNNIRKVMQEHHDDIFPVAGIADALKQTRSMAFNQAELEGLLAYKYGQSYTFTVLALLYPWLKFDQHFHIDHIFPRSMFSAKELSKRGIPQDQWHLWFEHVNDLANLQLLQGLPNQEKSDKEFEAWLQSSHPTRPELSNYYEHHLIPDVDLSFENFPKFLAAREKLIMERLAALLNVQLTAVEESSAG